MVQVTYNPPWISTETFGDRISLTGQIGEVEVSNERGKQEVIAHLLLEKDIHVRMSVWGNNLKTLIAYCGSDTEKWKGAKIKVSAKREKDKVHKVIDVLEKASN